MSVPKEFDSIESIFSFVKNNPEYCIKEGCMSVYGCDRRMRHGLEGCLSCKYLIAGTWKENHSNDFEVGI